MHVILPEHSIDAGGLLSGHSKVTMRENSAPMEIVAGPAKRVAEVRDEIRNMASAYFTTKEIERQKMSPRECAMGASVIGCTAVKHHAETTEFVFKET